MSNRRRTIQGITRRPTILKRADVSGYPGPGEKNAYLCDTCGGYTVVAHADHGVTPMFLACRASDDICGGRARSMMYPPQPWPDGVPTEPTHEWYLPTAKAASRMDQAMRIHFAQGGLALRPVSAAP